MAISGAHVGFKRRLYVSRAKETTYGTAQTLNYYFNTLPGSPMFRRNRAMVTDAELNKGAQDFPERQYHLEMGSGGSVRTWASPEAIGLFGSYALGGGDTVTGTTAKKHAIIPTTGGTFQGSLTLEEHSAGATVDANTDLQYLGCYVTRFRLSWSDTGMAMIEADLLGNGNTAAAGTQTEGGMTTASVFFPCARIGCWIQAVSAAGTSFWGGTWAAPTTAGAFNSYATYLDLSHQITSGAFEWVNTFGAAHPAGASASTGILGQQPVALRRSASLELTALRDTTSDDFIHALPAGTDAAPKEYSIIIEATSTVQTATTNHSAAIILPLAALESVPSGDDGELASETIRFAAKKTYAGTGFQPVHLFVSNAEANAYNQT